MEARLPAHVEAMALIRSAQGEGGVGMVIQKGERDAGALLVVMVENGANARLYERMPQPDGERIWHCSKQQNVDNPLEFNNYLNRRRAQDSDCWVIELDIANGERLIGLSSAQA